MRLPKIINDCISGLEKNDDESIALMGSYARNQNGKFSDIDIVYFSECDARETKIKLTKNKYTVISYVNTNEVENWFVDPELATELIGGLKTLIPLWDPKNYLGKLKVRASEFKWNNNLQKKANEFARKEIILLGEEVNKGIQGMISEDDGRMLNCIYGLSLGLTKVLRVHKGILLNSDNDSYYEIMTMYENEPETLQMIKRLFGILDGSLKNKVISGLLLYEKIVNELNYLFIDENEEIIKYLLSNISSVKKQTALRTRGD